MFTQWGWFVQFPQPQVDNSMVYDLINVLTPPPPLMGAKGDGVTNDSQVLSSIFKQKGIIIIPGVKFLIDSNLIIPDNANIIGTMGKTEFLIKDSFVKGSSLPSNEGAIYNEHFSQAYNDATADSISIFGVTFRHTRTNTNTIVTTMMFANIKSLSINYCKFIADGTQATNNFDLYACCKNVYFENNYVENMTGATAGGMWVRNLTTNGAIDLNASENIFIKHNIFKKNSNDEAIAIYGRDGIMRNVHFNENTINTTLSNNGKIPVVVLTVCAREDNGNANSFISDINVKDNIFNIEDFSFNVIAVGKDADTINTIRNITIINNKINCKVSATGSSTVIYVSGQSLNTKNVTINNNHIYNTGSTAIKTAIKSGNIVTNNIVDGNFSFSIGYCHVTANNRILNNSVGYAVENCTSVKNNIMLNVLFGTKYFGDGNFNVKSNEITLIDDATAIGISILNVSGTPKVYADDNFILTVNSSSKAFSKLAGELTIMNNIKDGPGKFIYSNAPVNFASNNRINSSGFDTLYPGRITDWDIESALPVGHITWDSTLPASKSGWQKIASGHDVDKWRQLAG